MKIANKKLKTIYETFLAEATRVEKKMYPVAGDLAPFIDHTLLKAEANLEQIEKLCQEARENNFKTVCVQPCFVSAAKKFLKNSKVLPITVIGFPLGANTTATKVFETKNALRNGAKEIDMVINISALKSFRGDDVFKDILAVKKACKKTPLKVIIETAYLSEREKVFLCACMKLAKVDFIKTSTGFASSGARLEDIFLFKHLLKNNVKIKASGGIKNAEQARAMIAAGANRLGTSSGVEIIKNLSSNKDY